MNTLDERYRGWGTVALLGGLLGLVTSVAAAQSRVVDDMSDPSRWRVIVPEGVTLSVHQDDGGGSDGSSLRLDYEFVAGGGYCIIQRALPMALPENYEFAFSVKGKGLDNNLEFKLLDTAHDAASDSDASQHSVWWVNRRAFAWPQAWTRLSNKKRRMEFAWGPSGGAPLSAISKVEFAIASSSGGKGSVWLDELMFRELPQPAPEDAGEPTPQGVSAAPGGQGQTAQAMIDADASTQWTSAVTDEAVGVTFDFGRVREFGGVDVQWGTLREAGSARVEASDDGKNWTVLADVGLTSAQAHARSVLVTPDAEARFVRLVVSPAASRSARMQVAVADVRFRDSAFSASPNSVVMALAKESPRGRYPKQFLNEASYWTVLGAAGKTEEALINEEGQIEIGKRMVSVDPVVMWNGAPLLWADATHTQRKAEGGVPEAIVQRVHAEASLSINAMVLDPDVAQSDQAWLVAQYRLTPNTALGRSGLALEVLPFQVNPPWQRLNFEGGVAEVTGVSEVERAGEGERVQIQSPRGDRSVFVVWSDDAAVGATSEFRTLVHTSEPYGSAQVRRFGRSGAEDGSVVSAVVLVPMERDAAELPGLVRGHGAAAIQSRVEQAFEQQRGRWREALGRTQIQVPASDRWLQETFASQLAYVLINRDGPAIQPGSRSYERSWARDGSMTSSALLELGFQQEVRAWIDWFGGHIFANGKVPCVVDVRGGDPVPEHDSHGQYIWAVASYYRFTKDRAFLEEHWPDVQRVVAYIQSLRAERSTSAYANSEGLMRAKFGLVPESISHEGYSAKPMHSYWDCFFVLVGLKEATYLARELGDHQRSDEYAREASDFRGKFMDSIARTRAHHQIAYIPGCVELGDFDSTSTTIALFPCDEGAYVDKQALLATFERYWQFFKDRRDRTGQFADAPYEAYTPYELRHVNTFVRLGWRERAHELLAYFRGDMRPAGWNHWAEVVWNDPSTPKFIGDMPHTWCGSDFLNSVLALFAYPETVRDGGTEQERLTCFAGVSKAWIESGEPIGIQNMQTPWGSVGLHMQREGNVVEATVTGSIVPPAGGLLLRMPPGVTGADVVVREVPARVSWNLQ